MKPTPRRRGFLSLCGATLGGGCLRLTSGGESPSTTESALGRDGSETDDSDSEAADADERTTSDGVLANGPLDDFPPGIDEDAVHEALAVTHGSILKRTSYTLEWVTNPNTRPERRIFEVEGDRTHIYYDTPQFEKTVDAFVTPDRTYHRVYYEGQTLYDVSDEPQWWANATSGEPMIETHVRAGAYRPTEVLERDGTPYVRLEARAFKDPSAILNVNGPEDVSAYRGEMLVREDGLVVEFRTTIEYAGNRDTRRTVIGLDDVGATTVAEPSWIGRASEREPTFEARMADDRSYIELRHVGGDAIESPVEISGYEGGVGTNLRARLESGVEKGQTLYLVLDTENTKLEALPDPPTSIDRPFEEYVKVRIWAGVHLDAIDVRAGQE